jgi:hypothetical protein
VVVQPRWRGHLLSPWWRRVVASLIDGLMVALPSTGLSLLVGVDLGEQFTSSGDESVLLPSGSDWLVQGATTLLATLIYFPSVMALTDGRTAGKPPFGFELSAPTVCR